MPVPPDLFPLASPPSTCWPLGASRCRRRFFASPCAGDQTPQAIIQMRLGDGQRFDPALVDRDCPTALRQAVRRQPRTICPTSFTNLNYDQYVAIRAVPPAQIWAARTAASPSSPSIGASCSRIRSASSSSRTGQSAASPMTAHGSITANSTFPPHIGDIGYSGVPPVFTNFGNGQTVDFAIVQGATFFRALARGQNYGVVARALTLKPAEVKGEEFPIFRAFWLERPSAGQQRITMHGLIDSESTSGSVRMTFRPGDMTIVDVETSLFPRVNLEHVGLGGMTSTYLFGANDRAKRRRRAAGRPRIRGPADAERARRMALAPAPESGNPPDLGVRRHLAPRLRPPATQSRLRGVSGRRAALRAPAEPVDRAPRRLGSGHACSCSRSRATPRSTTTSSPIGVRRRRWRPEPRSPSPIVSIGAGRRPNARPLRRSTRGSGAARPGGDGAFWSILRATCWETTRLRISSRP